MSDIEWQIRNWYNFSWLCGDSIVEQAVHSVDKIAWAMKDQPPVSCVARGRPPDTSRRRQYLRPLRGELSLSERHARLPREPPDGRLLQREFAITSWARKAPVPSAAGPAPRITGKTKWTFEGQKYDMYQKEHDELFAAIRKNQPINDGERMATSTMLAMMGRMAAYTGQQITWEQALNSQEQLSPDTIDWNGSFQAVAHAAAGSHEIPVRACSRFCCGTAALLCGGFPQRRAAGAGAELHRLPRGD